MANSNEKASLSPTMIKIFSVLALVLVFMATAQLITSVSRPSTTEKPAVAQQADETQLSALAIEGKDIFIQQGCTYCHGDQTQDASLILAGSLFAPKFPFQNQIMDTTQLSTYLAGLEQDSAVEAQTDEALTDEILTHSPQFNVLRGQMLSGAHTQAKMMLTSPAQRNRESLIEASEVTAGISELDALVAYLQETSTKKKL